MSSLKDKILSIGCSVVFADGFDEAICGFYFLEEVDGVVVCYDTNKCIKILVEQGMTIDEALEYFDFNVLGSYVGELTPKYIYTQEELFNN